MGGSLANDPIIPTLSHEERGKEQRLLLILSPLAGES
jgi:hypothetical protein